MASLVQELLLGRVLSHVLQDLGLTELANDETVAHEHDEYGYEEEHETDEGVVDATQRLVHLDHAVGVLAELIGARPRVRTPHLDVVLPHALVLLAVHEDGYGHGHREQPDEYDHVDGLATVEFLLHGANDGLEAFQ